MVGDGTSQFIKPIRLVEKANRTIAEQGVGDSLPTEPGSDEYRYVRIDPLYEAKDVAAVHVGHDEVQHDEIQLFVVAFEALHGFDTVPVGRHPATQRSEGSLEEVPDDLVVVDNEHIAFAVL
jgi:hypothetical protein